eukprot:CAMPEP_0184010172 /NCGR_PEP_ID=MMETSP0954-20121128/3052_1 /TAXON_ID=627963 /ORGANISM="Aplanochytrium sp, Strain PBS07" /LENGTH=166 /DNA_ID=CAMNT_0026289705 /DNA_START=216 /DNA_END=716 /DNA_ORIENTATION=-
MDATTTAEERAQAAAMREGQNKSSSEDQSSKSSEDVKQAILSEVPEVEIDADHKQKYVLIEVNATNLEKPVHLVRGRKWASYHKDVAEPTLTKLARCSVPGLRYNVLGGGRILHDSQVPKIEVYGYSYGFPWKDDVYRHEIAAELIKVAYPDFEVIHINDSSLGLY